MDTLALQKIREALPVGTAILVKEVTASTNDDLKELSLRESLTRPVVLFAEKQTAGRGRQGRSFFSEGGLYMSVLFPTLGAESEFLTHIAAVAVAEGIREIAKRPARIKWVNDIYLDGKKVCGILTESILRDNKRSYVLGIGVNVGTPKGEIPAELKNLMAYFEGDKSALAEAILRGIFKRIFSFDREQLQEEYAALSFLNGQRVRVSKGEKQAEALVLGLSEQLGLLVRYDTGKEEELIAGEVHLTL